MDRTLILFKPDAIQRGLVGTILQRFENKGLKIAAMKMTQIPRELAERHYAEHRGKPFFEGVVGYIISGPVVAAVLEGPSAVPVVRAMLGPTDGRTAPAGTIRGDFGIAMRYNLLHASDSEESARREIGIFFNEKELVDYDRDLQKWTWQV